MNSMDVHKRRKDEHIEEFLSSSHKNDNGFKDVILQNNALPEVNFNEIDSSVELFGKKAAAPIMINAITGGTEKTLEINRQLATIAKEFNIPMAVGSQSIALKNDESIASYSIVREIITDGIVIGNLGGGCSLEQVKKAADMIKADAMQLHINVAQEICMSEGDREFKGLTDNLIDVNNQLDIPVIIKEVGFGISKDAATRLINKGIEHIDIGGKGGTNFIEIENRRSLDHDYSSLYDWGISSAFSLIQADKARKENNTDTKLICTGGVSEVQDIVKALVVGADLVGISGALVELLLNHGERAAREYISETIHQIRVIMLLLGCNTIEDLNQASYLLKGELKELVSQI